MNIAPTTLNLESVIQDGDKILDQEHAAKELKSLGNLRAGNSGCITKDGDVYGTCHRISMARALGYSSPRGVDSGFFFDAGRGIENELAAKLLKSWKGTVLREEEAAIIWKVGDRVVTGRPDYFLLDEQGTPTLGIELKTICSHNSATRVWYEDKPEVTHLCQAGHMMWQKNVPWTLVYYNTANHITFGDTAKKFNVKWGTKVPPFRRYYNLYYKDGVLCYNNPSTGTTVETLITASGIQEYYELQDELLSKQQLGPRVSSTYADGSRKPYNTCRYCSFAKACDSYERDRDFDNWLDIIAQIVNGEKV